MNNKLNERLLPLLCWEEWGWGGVGYLFIGFFVFFIISRRHNFSPLFPLKRSDIKKKTYFRVKNA